MTNPMVRRMVISRGMPLLTQVTRVSRPWPPAAWSAMLASQMARYSDVRGGFCARPGRLVSSHEFTVPGARFHWPDQSGYLDSSNAAMPVTVITSTAIAGAASFAIGPIALRIEFMVSSVASGRLMCDARCPREYTLVRRAKEYARRDC